MKKIFFLLYIICLSASSVKAQRHSLGFFFNGIHNFSYLDNISDVEPTVKLPIYPLYTYGIEYSNKLGLYTSLALVQEGIRISRRFNPKRDNRILNKGRIVSTNGQAPSLKLGYLKKIASFRASFGFNFRYIGLGFVPISGATIFDNESYQPFAKFENTLDFRIHTSVYINVDYKFLKIGKNELRLNFIGNVGLHKIYQVTSIIEDFTTNETKRIIHNNYGTYLGLGLKFTRSTDDNFNDLFKLN